MSCPIDLGVFNICNDIRTGLLATETGSYVINLFFIGRYYALTLELYGGDEIIIPANKLNENAVVNMQITLPSGGVYTPVFTNGDESEETQFTFQTVYVISL